MRLPDSAVRGATRFFQRSLKKRYIFKIQQNLRDSKEIWKFHNAKNVMFLASERVDFENMSQREPLATK